MEGGAGATSGYLQDERVSPVRGLQPRSDQYLVELTAPAAQTAAGLYLPENWVENWTEGVVRAAGPGCPIAWPGATAAARGLMWADPGETVLFQKHDFLALAGRWGIVADDRLIGVLHPGPAFAPLNDWVMVEQDPEAMTDGGVVLAAAYRPRPMSGRIREWGPGRRRKTGPLGGLRQPVPDLLGLPRARLPDLRVYWTPECEVLACGREALEFLLIRAADLFAYEEGDT